MGKRIDRALKPYGEPPTEEHIPLEDLARIADRRLNEKERQAYLKHLVHCGRCLEILKGALMDASGVVVQEAHSPRGLLPRTLYVLAASFLLVVMVGGGLYLKFQSRPALLHATLPMDGDLESILLEDSSLEWQGKNARRMATLLRERGVPVKVDEIERLIVLARYSPSTTKGLFDYGESLRVRIEGNVIYVRVVKNMEPEERAR